MQVITMAEYINRDEFVKSQCHSCDGACENADCDCLKCKSIFRCSMIHDLMEFPAEEVAPVIRCRECKWFDGVADREIGKCNYETLIRYGDFFCANAERREES